jgi:hypothetical protein
MLTLSEDVSRTLTDRVWDDWQKTGINSRYMSLVEIKHLANHFLKMCREQNRDYREFDFYTMVDSNLNYYENLAELDNQLGQSQEVKETEASNKLKDYLTEEELKAYTPQQKTVIDNIETKNQTIEKKLSKLTKKIDAQETQQVETNEIKEQLEKLHNDQAQLIAKISNLPNRDQMIEALIESKAFKKLGEALKPITITQPQPTPKTKKQHSLPTWIKPKHEIRLLDAFAGIVTLIVWLAATGWIIQSFSLTYASIIGLSIFWLGFVVAFRLMIGGILD